MHIEMLVPTIHNWPALARHRLRLHYAMKRASGGRSDSNACAHVAKRWLPLVVCVGFRQLVDVESRSTWKTSEADSNALYFLSASPNGLYVLVEQNRNNEDAWLAYVYRMDGREILYETSYGMRTTCVVDNEGALWALNEKTLTLRANDGAPISSQSRHVWVSGEEVRVDCWNSGGFEVARRVKEDDSIVLSRGKAVVGKNVYRKEYMHRVATRTYPPPMTSSKYDEIHCCGSMWIGLTYQDENPTEPYCALTCVSETDHPHVSVSFAAAGQVLGMTSSRTVVCLASGEPDRLVFTSLIAPYAKKERPLLPSH